MLFRVDEMNFVRGKKGYVEFRMDAVHDCWDSKNRRNYTCSGYAFRVYSGVDMKCFAKLWLESIGRSCELDTFRSGKEVVDRYTSFVSRYGERFTFPVDDIQHGKIYSYV